MSQGIETICGACGNVRTVPGSALGKKFKCRSCGEVVAVEEEAEESSFLTGGDLDLGALTSTGTAIGTGAVVTCEECGEPFSKADEECPACDTPNPHYVAEPEYNRRAAREEDSISFFDKYRQLILMGGSLFGVILVITILVFALKSGTSATQSITGREQKEWYKRTTAKWIELEKVGKARRVEALWQDQRWMPLEQAIGLDWAAVPDWFATLDHPKAGRLAESMLGKWQTTQGNPYPEDLVAGIKDANTRVKFWSITMVPKLKEQKDKDAMVPELEKFRDGSDVELAKAAEKALEALGN